MRQKIQKVLADRQVWKFLAAGGLTVAVDYATFALLFRLDVPLVYATTCSYLAGFAVSFTVNKLWVFGADKSTQQHQTHRQLGLYVALLVCNLIFTYVFVRGLDALGVSPYIGKIGAMVLITIWNFVLYKKVIFVHKKPAA